MGNFYEEALQAIQEAVNTQFDGVVSRASRAWGIPNDNLTKWLKRERTPSLEGISPILARICDYSFNPSGKGSMRRASPNAPLEQVNGDKLPAIPVVGHAGAGDAVELFNQTPEFWLPVLPQYFRVGMVGLVVDGDSMEPTIHKDAVVGIMPYDGSITEGGIYLVQRPPFGRTIKRVRMGNDNLIELHSDKPAYKPVVIAPEGYENIISGKIVWIWQSC